MEQNGANQEEYVRQVLDAGYRWVLDADVRSFFDSIDHSLLQERLGRWLGAGSPMLIWMGQWLQAAVWDGADLTRITRGVAQGSPLSPILANFYLHEFDCRLRAAKIQFVRYADDFLVLARTPFDLTEARTKVEETLTDLRLVLSPEKTRVTTFEQHFRFLGAEIQGDAILQPFEKQKSPKRPYYVAPVMPPALLRAWRTGQIKAVKPLEWSGERRVRLQETAKPSGPPHPPDRGKASSASYRAARQRNLLKH